MIKASNGALIDFNNIDLKSLMANIPRSISAEDEALSNLCDLVMSNASVTTGTTATYNSLSMGEVKEINASGGVADLIEVTHLASTGGRKEYKPGFIDDGDLTVTFNSIPGDAGQAAVLADFGVNIVRTLTISYPSGLNLIISVIVQKAQEIPSAKVGGVEEFQVTFKVTGAVVRTTSQSTGLSALASSVGSLIPAFANNVLSYGYTVTAGTSSITVTPTAATGTITVSVNGGAPQTVTSGNPSTALAISVGLNIITIAVAETTKAPKIYTLYVTRAS